ANDQPMELVELGDDKQGSAETAYVVIGVVRGDDRPPRGNDLAGSGRLDDFELARLRTGGARDPEFGAQMGFEPVSETRVARDPQPSGRQHAIGELFAAFGGELREFFALGGAVEAVVHGDAYSPQHGRSSLKNGQDSGT